MLGIALVDGVALAQVGVPKLKVANGHIAVVMVNDARPKWAAMLGGLHKVAFCIVGVQKVLHPEPSLIADDVYPVSAVELFGFGLGAVEQILKPMGQHHVGVQVQEPTPAPTMAEPQINGATFVERVPILMHAGGLDTVHAIAAAQGNGAVVAWVGHNHYMVNLGKIDGERVLQEIGVILTNDNALNFHRSFLASHVGAVGGRVFWGFGPCGRERGAAVRALKFNVVPVVPHN